MSRNFIGGCDENWKFESNCDQIRFKKILINFKQNSCKFLKKVDQIKDKEIKKTDK